MTPAASGNVIVVPWLAAAVVYVVIVLVGSPVLNDPDIYTHVAIGRWVIVHGTVPTADPFSHTVIGQPWFAFEWLAGVIFALIFSFAGWQGIVGLTAACAAATAAIQLRFLLRYVSTIRAVEIVAVSVALMAAHIVARPHMLAYPILAGWCAGIVRAADEERTPSLWLLLVMPIWANLHGTFIVGLGFAGAIALETVIGAPAERRTAAIRRWALFLGTAGLLACVTPYGAQLFLTIGRIMELGPILMLVTEWRPADFSKLSVLEVVLLGSIGLALFLGIKLPPLRIVLLLGLLHLALSHARHASMLAVIAPFLIAAPLRERFKGPDSATPPYGRAALMAVLALCVVASLRPVSPPSATSPVDGLRAIRAATNGPILNGYDFGGYLIFAGERPSIDGTRAEMYGNEFVIRHFRATDGNSEQDLTAFLKDYKIAATLLTSKSPAVALLDRMPQWRRIHADSHAVAHIWMPTPN